MQRLSERRGNELQKSYKSAASGVQDRGRRVQEWNVIFVALADLIHLYYRGTGRVCQMFVPLVCTDDVQQEPALGYCARCGNELYSYDDGDICTECREEIKSPETVVKYAEAWPRRWFKTSVCCVSESPISGQVPA